MDFQLPQIDLREMASTSTSTPKIGRPKKSFEEASEKTKRRKGQLLKNVGSPDELMYAAQLSFKESGKSDTARVLKNISESPNRASKIRRLYEKYRKVDADQLTPRYTDDEALALLVDAKLSKAQYNLIRMQAKSKKSDLYPSYNIIREAKKRCYPENITITETSARITLQSLLNHTAKRILLGANFSQDHLGEFKEIEMMSKWGCDGSSSHSQYKQKFLDENSSDADIFLISLVPLIIYGKHQPTDPIKKENILWQNPSTSSTKYCRPINILFAKETSALAVHEVNRINEEISNLQPTTISFSRRRFTLQIKHSLALTMIDGKICNAISDNPSSQVCYICGGTPKEMNKIKKITEKAVDHSSLKFGLSSLHAWIKFFECLLHLSYRIDFKKWQARNEDKVLLKARKERIQKEFKTKMGLIVDKPNPRGSGTSNDGNTARRFFANPELSSSITGVDIDIIKRFGIILQVISCGQEVDTEKFNNYAIKTANLFVKKYPWFYMPVSVHKVLIHGAQIIQFAILPIGQMSEEAQEACNKNIRRYREHHTRKNSRIDTMTDLVHDLLISSDPYISSKRRKGQRRNTPLSGEAKILLKDRENEEESDNENLEMQTESSESKNNESEDFSSE